MTQDTKISSVWLGKTPAAFAGADIFKKENKSALSQRALIRNHLPSIPTYQKFRTFKKPRIFNPYFVYTKRKIIQSDLLHMQYPKGIVKENKGFAYILVVQDIFSRKIWTQPLKTKKADELVTHIDKILKQLQPFQRNARFVIDRGTEYLNKTVRQILRKYRLNISHPSDGHASHVERSIFSLQRILYQQMNADGNSLKWIDKLADAENIMNTRYHRIIRMSPNSAEKAKNADKVNEAMAIYRQKAFQKRKSTKKLNIGDSVRIHKWKNKFSRGYQQNFSTEIFQIKKVLDHLPITMYQLVDLKNEPVDGNFYIEELSVVKGDTYIVEKILKHKTQNKKKWYFVKWEGFPEKYNSWVKQDDLQ